MSEPVSAFAAYKANGVKGKTGAAKKTAATSNGAKGKPRPAGKGKGAQGKATGAQGKPTGAQGKAAGAQGKPTGAQARAAAPKAKTAGAKDKPNNKATVNGKAGVKATTVKATTTVNAASKPQAKNNTARAKAAPNKAAPANNRKTGAKTIGADTFTELIENSPSKLSATQLKKKKQMDEYLLRQLEKDDQNDLSEDESFSDEYTLNSYSDDDEEEEEDDDCCCEEGEEDDDSESGSESEGSQSSNEEEATASKGVAAANAKGVAQKRKSNDAVVENKTKATPAETKKSKTDTARTSLPASTANVKEKPTLTKRKSLSAIDTKQSSNMNGSPVVKLEPLSPPSNVVKMNSIDEGEKAFHWLIQPITVEDFFDKYWEKSACLLKRNQDRLFRHLISFEAIDQMFLKHHVEFTKNIDITSYKNGVRETHNPEGRAMPPAVWDFYGQGCSIRLLNPQTFLPALCSLNTTLQEFFHCLVGANAYLTPPNSQGFAPHYDDIEAFVLQIEGRKRWRLYEPRTQNEMLPRDSSPNFTQAEIGKPILDQVLKPGDVLYFPRGTIHQASTEPGFHSLHITLSVYQKQSYADLFERMMPLMLQRAIKTNLDLRRGLPMHTWRNAGVAFSECDTKERAELLEKVTKLMGKCLKSIPLAKIMDAAVDQVAKKYHYEALPPEIQAAERTRTIFGSHSKTNEQGECIADYEIDVRTNVRLLRANILRLVDEEDSVRIYYYLDNSKVYCEYEPNFIEIERAEAASVEVLIKSYPAYIGVSQLPIKEDERKIQIATALWERGLLMVEKPFV